jgi:hypothetical protein
VHLEAEVSAAADQVAERARAELVLGYRDRFVDDERRAAGMLEQARFERGEDCRRGPVRPTRAGPRSPRRQRAPNAPRVIHQFDGLSQSQKRAQNR